MVDFMENLFFNGWFLGSPILGKPHMGLWAYESISLTWELIAYVWEGKMGHAVPVGPVGPVGHSRAGRCEAHDYWSDDRSFCGLGWWLELRQDSWSQFENLLGDWRLWAVPRGLCFAATYHSIIACWEDDFGCYIYIYIYDIMYSV